MLLINNIRNVLSLVTDTENQVQMEVVLLFLLSQEECWW